MKAQIGDEGTEQFTVETWVDDQRIKVQPIHDPFIHTTTVIILSRWAHFMAIFRRREIRVRVHVWGSEGAQRAIMALDPKDLQHDTDEIVEARRVSCELYNRNGHERYPCVDS